MPLEQLYALIGAIFSFVVLILVIYMLLNRNKNNDLNTFENSILNEVKDMESTMTKSISESMLNFNNLVNEQLRNQSKTSSDSITEFRINVNKELSNFKDNINDNLTKDFKSLNDSIEKKMFEINNKVEERLAKGFKDTNETFNQIVERVAVIDEAQKKIKDLSEEMVSLQNILSNNQARGSFGEYQLNQLLMSVFGENKKLYDTQYTLKKGNKEVVRADAVIFMPEPRGLIAIDSKFPYSSYSRLFDNNQLTKEEEEKIISDFSREVKKHITDISAKYIIPGTTADYAIMFVPSDGILALIHSRLPAVVEYARNKFITIVSPTTLVPLLSSFQSMVIDHERSKYINEIITQLKKLRTNFNNFEGEWAKLNRSIDTLRNDGDKVNKRVERITTRFKDIDKVNFIEGSTSENQDDNQNE